MMGPQVAQGALFYEFSIEDHVPPDHLLRAIDRFVDLGGMRRHLARYYSSTGRPSIDPELMEFEPSLTPGAWRDRLQYIRPNAATMDKSPPCKLGQIEEGDSARLGRQSDDVARYFPEMASGRQL